MTDTDVLIVGAGPSGLMMACQLAINKIAFRIIDKNEDHTSQSRALVIQARSMEILDQMGIADKAMQEGKIARAVGVIFNGKKVLRIFINDMGHGLTQFPFLFMLEQSFTESILIDFLKGHGCEVERKTELTNLNQSHDEAMASLKLPNEKEETIKVNYIIGADGTHSAVREELKIPFAGKTYHESLFVLDCKAIVDLPQDEMYIAFARKAIGGFFPLVNGRWRILGNLPRELEQKGEITFNDIEKSFAGRICMNVKLSDPQWISVYRSHHRYASSFRQGRCFLIGDAAHIHSPIGAQGMNTGLQDACNLAWKLVLVLNGKAKNSLLDTYTEERITIARDLVRSTDRAFNLVTSTSRTLAIFRSYLLPVALKIGAPIFQNLKCIQRFAFKKISEIGINYRQKSLAQDASSGKFPRHTPKPGDRLPFILFQETNEKKINIQNKTNARFFTLFIFSNSIPQEITSSLKRFTDLFSIEIFPFADQTKILYKKLGIRHCGCYLVRPDMYVAYRSQKFDHQHLLKYLSSFMR